MTRLANVIQILVVLSMTAVILGEFGRWHFLPDLLCHFRIQATGTLVLAGTLLWFLKRRKWSVASLLFGFILLASLSHFIWPSAEQGGDTYRLLTMNVLTGNPQKDRVTDYILAQDPDFIFVQEIDQTWVNWLDAKLSETWAHSKTVPRDDNFGIGIYSKRPWSQCDVLQLSNAIGTPSISSEFRLPDGNPLRIIVTHPVPPMNDAYWRSRNELFVSLALDVRSGDATRTIVAGDLNCSPWSWHFRELLRQSALENSATGHGLSISWLPIPITALGLPIDHVLVGESIAVHDRVVGPYLASDHRPVVVDFR